MVRLFIDVCGRVIAALSFERNSAVGDIFISHSSQDAQLARNVAQALQASNYVSLFLDFDEQHGIKAFEDWERVLYRKLWATRAVVAICTNHSLESKWCFAEIAIARALGKPVLPVVGDPLEERPDRQALGAARCSPDC
jgi:TIR domain